MKHIVANRVYPKETSWAKQFMEREHFDQVINETTFISREDGSPLAVLLKNVIPVEINAQAWSVLKKYNPKTENRSVASGIDAVPRKKGDGTMSKVTRVPKGWEVISGVIGYFERNVRMPYCHACAWNDKFPEKFENLYPLIGKINDLYKEHVPDKWLFQNEFVKKTPSDYIIKNTVFSTVTLNKNFRTAAHQDAGDLTDGFSCLSVIREGQYKGAELVLPNYRIAIDVQMGDLLLFDPHEYHGNTQIIPITPNATRCSMVYYYREMMQHCLPKAEELNRVKNRKPGDPLYER